MKLFRTDYPLTPSFALIKPSLDLLRAQIWPVFYLLFLPSLTTVVGAVLMGDIGANSDPSEFVLTERRAAGFLIVTAGLVWTLLTYPGALIMQLRAIRGEQPMALECFKAGMPYVLPLLWMNILRSLAVFFGLIALIVPGLFLLRSFYLGEYYLVDKKLGAVESLKHSRKDSLPNAGYIWGTIGVAILFGMLSNILGEIPVAGYLIAVAVVLLFAFGPALRYNEISKLTPAKSTQE